MHLFALYEHALFTYGTEFWNGLQGLGVVLDLAVVCFCFNLSCFIISTEQFSVLIIIFFKFLKNHMFGDFPSFHFPEPRYICWFVLYAITWCNFNFNCDAVKVIRCFGILIHN